MAAQAPRRRRRSNPIPAVLRLPEGKAASILRTRRANAVIETNGQEDESLHCLLDTGMLQNGYPSASWSHTEANVQVSHLVLLEKGLIHVPHRIHKQTASHLCHNKRCIRPEHIICESIGRNGSRNRCMAFVDLPDGQRIVACGHVPRCLLPSPLAHRP
eukprot:m.164542 g.164542  ORF g.164542 m.164542 type:complete len:159 (+) comp15224_c0_seq1:725-1201(+)